MKITSKIVWDVDFNVLEHEWHDYLGAVSELKGGASKQEQQAADSQRAMENNFMQQQLNAQMGTLGIGAGGTAMQGGAKSMLDQIIANRGMLPEQQAAMTALTMNQLPATFNSLQGQLNQNLVARGITGGQQGAGGGEAARGFGQLGAMEGALQQQGLSNIQLAKGQGLNQAISGEMGMADILGRNVSGFNSGALNALSSGVTAAHNADQAGTGLWGSLLGGAMGLGSSFLPGGQAAGALGLFNRARPSGGGGGATTAGGMGSFPGAY